jgi:hypothetical protein
MTRVLMFVLASCLATFVALAQPGTQVPPAAEAEILAVIDQFMIAISTKDNDLMARIRVEGTFSVVERPAEGGKGTVVTRRPDKPITPGGETFLERYWDPIVHVRGSLAVVWTPYEFWRDGKTSHCGIDTFDLMKDQGQWKIVNAMWTVEPDACPAMRPKDPSRIRPKK